MKINELKQRYVELFSNEGVDTQTLVNIQKRLDVLFPIDFIEIAKFYSGGILGGISHFSIAMTGPADNIVNETIRLRSSTGLPSRYVVIAEPPESLIVLDTFANGGPSVIWLDSTDIGNIKKGNSLSSPTLWKTYSEFFEYLINEEIGENEIGGYVSK
jgi:hypothetical protein